MSIHQVSVAYQPDQDRLLLRVRTRDDQLFELWLTRRMMVRLWQPLQNTASAASLGAASPAATVLPEAREMMTQALRDQARQHADFDSPFDDQATVRPLGDQPLLVAAVDMQRHTDGHVDLVWRDAAQRRLSLSLGPELLNNLLSLLESALAQSEWGLTAKAEAPPDPARSPPALPRVLN